MAPIIYSPNGLLSFQPSLPEKWRGKILSGSSPWYYEGSEGTLLIQKFENDEFSIMYMVCSFSQKTTLQWKEEPFLKLQYVLEGRLNYRNEENKAIKLRSGQMNAVWAPERKTDYAFSKGRFDFFQLEIGTHFVKELRPAFPAPDTFPRETLKQWFGKYPSGDPTPINF